MAKTTRILDRRGNVASPDTNFTGEEPTWTDAAELSIQDYYDRYAKGLRFYAYYCNSGDLMPLLLKWMKTNGYREDDIKLFSSIPASYIPVTLCSLARMLSRGMPALHPDAFSHYEKKHAETPPEKLPKKPIGVDVYLKSEIRHIIDTYARPDVKSVDSAPKENVKSPHQRLMEKIHKEVMLPLEDYLDGILEKKDEKVIGKHSFNHLGLLLRNNNVPAAALKPIADYLQSQLEEWKGAFNKECPQLVEGYGIYSRPFQRRYIELLEKFIESVYEHGKIKNKTRKPRVKKPRAADKQIKSLKYEDSNEEYGLKSIDPIKLPFAQRAYFFNTKNRQLSIYYSNSHDGFLIKGTSLQNFDPEKSVTFTLRKPHECLNAIMTGTPRKIDKYIETLKTKQKPANGRTNANMIIVKILDNR